MPGKNPPAVQMPARIAMLTRWRDDQPKPGHEQLQWFDRIAAETGHSVPQVRRVIGEEASAFYGALRGAMKNEVARVASYLAVDEIKAIQVIADAMEAMEVIVVRDKLGNPLYDADGNPRLIHKRLWPIQLKAAELLLTMFGAFQERKPAPPAAPQVKVQMQTRTGMNGEVTSMVSAVVEAPADPQSLNDEEVHERYWAMRREVDERLRLLAPAGDNGGGGAEIPGAAAAGTGPRSADPQGSGRDGISPDRNDDPQMPAGSVLLDHRADAD